eukprot:13983273-Ditylum_brightwellii.AAC.1
MHFPLKYTASKRAPRRYKKQSKIPTQQAAPAVLKVALCNFLSFPPSCLLQPGFDEPKEVSSGALSAK